MTARRCRICRRCGRARTPIPPFRPRSAEQAISVGRAADQHSAVRKHARSHPQDVSRAGTDQRRAPEPLRRSVRCRKRSTMGYYDGSKLPMWKWAQEYTLADNFFMGALATRSSITSGWCAHARRSIRRRPATSRPARRARLAQAPARIAAIRARGAGRVRPPAEIHGRRLPAIATNQPPYQPSRVPPAARGDPRLTDPEGARAPAADGSRRLATRCRPRAFSWAWNSGRRGRGREGRHAGPRRRSAKVIYNDAPGRAVLRHASSAVQLLRAVCPGARRIASGISRTIPTSSPEIAEGDAAAGGVLQAAGQSQRAFRPRRRTVGRHSHRRPGRADQDEPAVGI